MELHTGNLLIWYEILVNGCKSFLIILITFMVGMMEMQLLVIDCTGK